MAEPALQPPREAASASAWPTGWALPLIESPATTEPTRRALRARLNAPAGLPVGALPAFFSPDAYETFAAACARLVPADGLAGPVDVAPAIDARLACGHGDGWRYATLPPDGDAFQTGVSLLDRAAEAAYAERFCDLAPDAQDELLADAQHARGAFGPDASGGFDACRWFADWLAEAAGLFYGHPLAQQDIGYAGFADAPGWTRIGLGERDAHEPDPLTDALL
ncbi:MAG TPA: gluconate 2-dehydrogenase subunit 3 family protein [Rubricoccaceae bacterium]